MVIVELDEERKFYMDGGLANNLDELKEGILDDKDYVFIIDGLERNGKTTLAIQMAGKLDPTFNLSRVCFTHEEFEDVVRNKAQKGQAVVYDEAYDSLNSKASLSSISQSLISLMTRMGALNLFIFIVLPSIHLLQPYVAMFRSVALVHVYTDDKGKRGRWCLYNQDKKKLVYLLGKKTFSYSGKGIPNSAFRGRFLNQWTVIDKKDYLKKKDKSLRTDDEFISKYLPQRDRLLFYIYNLGFKYREISEVCETLGFPLKTSAIAMAVNRVNLSMK